MIGGIDRIVPIEFIGGGAAPPPAPTLADLYANGEVGGVYSSESLRWQDVAKTIPANAASNPLRVWEPVFGTAELNATSDPSRPTLNVDLDATFDGSDDLLFYNILGVGTMLIATRRGIYWGLMNFTSGNLSSQRAINFASLNPKLPITGVLTIDRVLSASEIDLAKSYFVGRGAVAPMSGVFNYFAAGIGYVSFGPVDSAAVTDFSAGWYSSRLTSMSPMDMSGSTTFNFSWAFTHLTSFPYAGLQGSHATNYGNAWTGNDLEALSVDGILYTINNNRLALGLGPGVITLTGGTNSPPTNGTVTGIDGIAAKTALQAASWTVNTN